MATERTVPILPCRHLDDVLPFYQALGFEQTFRQTRPNPCLGLRRGGIELMFFGLESFVPADSMGSAIVLVPDTGALFDAFAAGLRAAYGKLPVAGIPRITRPRRKQGTAAGFTVVDPGGNWLRIFRDGDSEQSEPPESRLERVLQNAARQGDARGDVGNAIAVLDAGLDRHADAPAAERLPLLVYRAELLIRSGDRVRAGETIQEIRALDGPLPAAELEAVAELERQL